MAAEKKITLDKTTVMESGITPALGPVTIEIPGWGTALCHDAASFTASRIEHDEAGMLVAVITSGFFDGRLLGLITGMTPDQARSMAASLLAAADQCDGGIKGAN